MALLIVINQPASSLDGRDIYIGPTAVDFSCLEAEKHRRALEQSEARRIASWRRQDVSAYRGRGSLR